MNKIIFITGMAGAGKSSVGRMLARRFPKCLFIQVDELREKMVTGYARPQDGVFTEEVMGQFQMARTTAIQMARLYAGNGVDVVIDDVCVPPNFVEQYAALFELPEVHRVLLYPEESVVIERIKKRKRLCSRMRRDADRYGRAGVVMSTTACDIRRLHG